MKNSIKQKDIYLPDGKNGFTATTSSLILKSYEGWFYHWN